MFIFRFAHGTAQISERFKTLSTTDQKQAVKKAVNRDYVDRKDKDGNIIRVVLLADKE